MFDGQFAVCSTSEHLQHPEPALLPGAVHLVTYGETKRGSQTSAWGRGSVWLAKVAGRVLGMRVSGLPLETKA